MQRTVSICSPANRNRFEHARTFLLEYNHCVNYFIERYWSEHNFDDSYVDTVHMENAKERFSLTARLIQCAGRQALQIVKSQRMKSIRRRRMPRYNVLSATLDGRFWAITGEHNSFEWIKVQSGFKLFLPFRKTAMWNKWSGAGFTLSESMRLLIRGDNLYVDFIFEKDAPAPRTEGEVTGMDSGYVDMAVCSDGQVAGKGMNDFIRSFAAREKHTHRQVEQKAFSELKKLDLSGVRMLVIEDLHSVKSRTRGMFPREHNRRLSHWLYAREAEWLAQRCEELGIELRRVSPWKTSQFCRFCGKWDGRSRSGKMFRCVHCGHTDDADMNGAQNIRLMGLAGVYSLRSLPNEFTGGNICL